MKRLSLYFSIGLVSSVCFEADAAGILRQRAAQAVRAASFVPIQGVVRSNWMPSSYLSQIRFASIAAKTPVLPGEYAVATTDIAFKQLLNPAEDKEVIISFLNTFVPVFAHDPVKDVRGAPTTIPPLPKTEEEKTTFMDMHVVASSGTRYIIEMQAHRHIQFDERALFYLCNTYGRQLSQTELSHKSWFRFLNPTIAIQVLDYDTNRIRGIADEELEDAMVNRVKDHKLPEGEFMKHYRLVDAKSGQEIRHIQMVQVELPRYIKRALFPPKKDFTPLEWWLSVLRHSKEYTHDYIETLSKQGIEMPDVIKKGFDRLSYRLWNAEMKREYNLQVADRELFATEYAVERSEGRAEGKAEGRAEGMIEGKIEVIRQLVIDGVLTKTQAAERIAKLKNE